MDLRWFPAPLSLWAALETRVLSLDAVRAWADHHILAADGELPDWLIALSLSMTPAAAISAIETAVGDRDGELDKACRWRVAMWFSRFLHGEIGHAEMRSQIGLTLDPDVYVAGLEVEGWYMETEAGIPPALHAALEGMARDAERELARVLALESLDRFWDVGSDQWP